MDNKINQTSILLRDICESIQYGYTASATVKPEGPKFLRITDIVPDIINWSSVPFCSIPEKDRKKYFLYEGDIVIARTGATTGYAKYLKNVPESIFASYLVRLRIQKSVNARYIGYIVESEDYKYFIKTNWGGAAQPNANAQILTSYPIILPPLLSQRKIASILSAYDDLIKNNLRRIKILEEMAQNLYREWFVKFRFPGHENTRFVDSPLGRIPEGWEVKPLLLLSDVTYGYAFKSKKFNSSRIGLPVIRIRDVLAGSSSTFSSEDPGSKYLVENGDILVGMDGDFHMGIWVGGKALLVQRVARFRKKRNMSIGNYYLFLALQEPIRTFNATITGTTVAHLGDKHIKTITILLPTIKIIDYINSILEPMLKQIISLRQKNSTLRQTRDLLLPKLISGEVDVTDMEIKIP